MFLGLLTRVQDTDRSNALHSTRLVPCIRSNFLCRSIVVSVFLQEEYGSQRGERCLLGHQITSWKEEGDVHFKPAELITHLARIAERSPESFSV